MSLVFSPAASYCQGFVKGKSPLLVVKPAGWGYGEAISSRLSWNSLSFIWLLSCRIMQSYKHCSQSYKQLCSQLSGITENINFGFLERSISPLVLVIHPPLSITSWWWVTPKEWLSKVCRSRSSGKNLESLNWLLPKKRDREQIKLPREVPSPYSAMAVGHSPYPRAAESWFCALCQQSARERSISDICV